MGANVLIITGSVVTIGPDDTAMVLAEKNDSWPAKYARNLERGPPVYEYREIFDNAVLLTIREHRQFGHGRPELSAAHRIFPAGRDIIVYRTTGWVILVCPFCISGWTSAPICNFKTK
jgi:toxin ParE1/3/4